MKNSNRYQAAFTGQSRNAGGAISGNFQEGLTKLEYIAALALQGYLSNPAAGALTVEEIAQLASRNAHALLDVLEEK